MGNTSLNAGALRRRILGRTGDDYLRYGLRFSLWMRWFAVVAWLAQLHNQISLANPSYVAHALFAVVLLSLNGYVHYRIEARRTVTWRWAFALSAMDVVILTGGLTIYSGDASTIFVLYYAGLALFAAVCTSVRVSLVATTMVAALYVVLGSTVGPSGGLEIIERETLLTNVIAMYAVVGAVSLVSRFEQVRANLERARRRQAVDRERDLLRERVELSQAIHDTIAQSAFTIGLGLETAIELADAQEYENRKDLVAKLQAMLALSKSTMWELRHPIDAGAIFEGRELNRVLRSHSSTFSAITSIPTELVQSGSEPPLCAATRRRLFSIAHNAMTNALRHARAEKIAIQLNFEEDHIQMLIEDDGVGLAGDCSAHGHGLRNMRSEAERIGGTLEVIPGESGRGTAIACTVPKRRRSGSCVACQRLHRRAS